MIKDVYKFNEEIVKTEKVEKLNEERLQWFKNVVNEELLEFVEAHNNNDKVGMLDAIIDNIYFIIGRAYELGITEEQFKLSFKAIHECNMNKKRGNKGRGSDMDAIKDSTWIGPEEKIAKILGV